MYPFAFSTSIADLKEPTPGKISRFALLISSGLLTCMFSNKCSKHPFKTTRIHADITSSDRLMINYDLECQTTTLN